MVKLGSLYRGPQDAPMSYRIRNIPTAPASSIVNNSKCNSNSSLSVSHQISSREQHSKHRRDDIQVITENKKGVFFSQNKLRSTRIFD